MSRPFDFPLLADENIRPDVVVALASVGRNIRTVHEEHLTGASDVEILRRARALGRVVLAHDSDFGRLAIQSGEPIVGIICLRPGHISPAVVLQTFRGSGQRSSRPIASFHRGRRSPRR
jgi:predicted nuclease of predicted toxin-antitoxin system